MTQSMKFSMQQTIRQLNEKDLQFIIRKIQYLPSLPTTIDQLNQLLKDPNTNARQLADLIAQDQALAARLLKMANSAFYGFPRKIPTINLAIVVLGFDALQHLAISLTAVKDLSGEDAPGFKVKKFWDHCLAVGMIAKILAQESNYKISNEAFVAGLLHDIGLLVTKEHMEEHFLHFLHLVDEGMGTEEAQLEAFGFGSEKVSWLLANKWNLPEEITEAVGVYKKPAEANINPRLCYLVHIAHVIAQELGFGNLNENIALVEPDPGIIRLKKTSWGEIDKTYYTSLVEKELEKVQPFREFIGEDL